MKPNNCPARIFVLYSFIIFCSITIHAQVGVNTTSPDASAALDMTSTDKGFMMTKVALTGTDDMTTITPSPATGLLVYNTATSGSAGLEVIPGFYYFNGASWRRFYTDGYTLSYDQTAAVTASTTNTDYVILPGLDTGNITVPFSGTYQIRVEGYYAAGDLISTAGDGAAQGSISLAMSSSGGGSSGGACTGGISSFPYSESFESGLGAWTQGTGDNNDWTRLSGATPSNNTGPSSASDGSFYMFVEASGNGSGYPNRRAYLDSPCLDLSAFSSASITFDYHMYGAADFGSLTLEASNDNGTSWTSLWSLSGNQGNSWHTQTVDLSGYTGDSVQLRFNRVTGGTWQADAAIDNIIVNNVAGPAPSLTTVKETYITTSSKYLSSSATTINNLAQSASILVNMDLYAGVTYRFAVRGREWLANNVGTGSYGRDTSGYSGSNSIPNAQRGTMKISLIRQF